MVEPISGCKPMYLYQFNFFFNFWDGVFSPVTRLCLLLGSNSIFFLYSKIMECNGMGIGVNHDFSPGPFRRNFVWGDLLRGLCGARVWL